MIYLMAEGPGGFVSNLQKMSDFSLQFLPQKKKIIKMHQNIFLQKLKSPPHRFIIRNNLTGNRITQEVDCTHGTFLHLLGAQLQSAASSLLCCEDAEM